MQPHSIVEWLRRRRAVAARMYRPSGGMSGPGIRSLFGLTVRRQAGRPLLLAVPDWRERMLAVLARRAVRPMRPAWVETPVEETEATLASEPGIATTDQDPRPAVSVGDIDFVTPPVPPLASRPSPSPAIVPAAPRETASIAESRVLDRPSAAPQAADSRTTETGRQTPAEQARGRRRRPSLGGTPSAPPEVRPTVHPPVAEAATASPAPAPDTHRPESRDLAPARTPREEMAEPLASLGATEQAEVPHAEAPDPERGLERAVFSGDSAATIDAPAALAPKASVASAPPAAPRSAAISTDAPVAKDPIAADGARREAARPARPAREARSAKPRVPPGDDSHTEVVPPTDGPTLIEALGGDAGVSLPVSGPDSSAERRGSQRDERDIRAVDEILVAPRGPAATTEPGVPRAEPVTTAPPPTTELPTSPGGPLASHREVDVEAPHSPRVPTPAISGERARESVAPSDASTSPAHQPAAPLAHERSGDAAPVQSAPGPGISSLPSPSREGERTADTGRHAVAKREADAAPIAPDGEPVTPLPAPAAAAPGDVSVGASMRDAPGEAAKLGFRVSEERRGRRQVAATEPPPPKPAPAKPADAAKGAVEEARSPDPNERSIAEWRRLLAAATGGRVPSAPPGPVHGEASAQVGAPTPHPPATDVPTTEPLLESTRRFLRPRVGIDPATVPVVRGAAAERVVFAAGADAAAVGETIALPSAFDERSPRTLGLVAHELTHVAQRRQTRFVPPAARPATVSARVTAPPAGTSSFAPSDEAMARHTERAVWHDAERTSGGAPQPARATIESPAPGVDDVRDRPSPWGGLPAPWEPLALGEFAASEVSALPAPGVETAVRYAPHDRPLEGEPTAAAPGAAHAESAPMPDLDVLARRVYDVLKRRIAAERRREG